MKKPKEENPAKFFLAANLYLTHKVSFQRAAELAGMSFEEFKAGLKKHFNTGYILSDEVVTDDLVVVEQLISDS